MLKLINGETITEEIKNQFKRSATNAYIKLNDGTILGSRNYIKSIKLENLRYNEETNKILGEAISRRVTLDLFNQENELNIENKEFELLIGAQINEPQRNPNLFNINDILLMSEQVSIDENDIITATYDNSEGKEDKFLNVFTNITALLETSKKYYAVLEILEVSGTGGIYLTDSATEKESFNELSNGQILKYRITTLDNFLKSDTVLKTYIKFLPGESGTIKFRISLFDISINLDNFNYKPFTEEYKYISFGNFIVQKPDNSDTKESTTLEAFDYMIKFNKPYISRVTYPCTYLELAQDVCDQCGVELGSKDFRNADKILTQNPFINGEHCRVVIKAIAREVAFSWARIREDNKLYFDFNINNSVAETITVDDYIELGNNDETIPVNTIILQDISIESENITIKNDELISEYGKQKELILKTEYFAFTQELRQEYISAAEALMGLVYYPVTLKGIGSIYLDNNDIISIENKKGNNLNTYCFDHIIDYNGVLHDDINSPAMTETETEYQHESQQDLDRRRTEIIVDKANQNIQILTEKKVNNDEIIARINMAIRNIESAEIPEGIEKSIIEILANKISIKSDYFELTEDGQIIAKRGDIGNLFLYQNTYGSWLNKNFETTDKSRKYQSGLFIPDSIDYINSPFIYAGLDMNDDTGITNANAYITHEGKMRAKWFEVNGQSGHFKINYDSGRQAISLKPSGLHWKIDDEGNGSFFGFNMAEKGVSTELYDARWFTLVDQVHRSKIIDITRMEPDDVGYKNQDRHFMYINGDVDIYDTDYKNREYELYLNGYNVLTSASDERIKKNIVDSEIEALKLINKIHHKSFDWNKEKAHKEGHIDIGYIAQELIKIDSNFVVYSERHDTYQINTLYVLCTATKAIQELDDKIDKQQKMIEFLADKLGCREELENL